ncbi:MAG: heme ABC transporter permease [Legionellales bacterium RIFCSPHIGHO2_12_FULL_35_11]|nr:MAG: heme ABC transporter permease [Legionellales bacterium RIFCSPHIGHO2_12_FULL_35_11]
MRKVLYQLLTTKYFYFQTRFWLPWLGCGAFSMLLIGVFWGLFIAPVDYQQADAVRIIYLHVPAAFLSIALYAWMGGCALLLLIWQIKLAGIMLPIIAELGMIMTLIALITGCIWGKPMWGTWWIWDARLTSEFILLLLYCSILAIKHSLIDSDQCSKLISVLAIVGLIDLPIIHYSVYWWNTLHQGASLSLFNKPNIATSMLYPLLFNLFGFSLYCIWVILHKTSSAVLYRERKQAWLIEIIKKREL